MKLTLFFFITFSQMAFAQDDLKICRFDLVGPETLHDSIILPSPMTKKKCRKEALNLLQKNLEYYNSVILKDIESGKIEVLTVKDLKN